jgi:hypothetical protein
MSHFGLDILDLLRVSTAHSEVFAYSILALSTVVDILTYFALLIWPMLA